MIAFASRYGHQTLDVLGQMTSAQVQRFCDALIPWIEAERKNGKTAALNAMAEGGG